MNVELVYFLKNTGKHFDPIVTGYIVRMEKNCRTPQEQIRSSVNMVNL